MPQKTLDLVAGLGGLLVVGAIAVLGYDIYRAARTGPRWKRRLVGAGLALLAAISPFACGRNADSAPPTGTRPADGKPASKASHYAQTAEWRRLLAIWREAGEIGSGKRGAYPFDRAGRRRVLADLARAGTDLGTLEQARLLSAAEVGLLREDLAQLTRGVQAKRPTEMRRATCYEPMALTPARDSVGRLAARLPFLEALAGAERLRPEVVRKALVSIERDLATLANPQMLRRLSEADRARATALRDSVARHVDRLRASIEGRPAATSTPAPAGGRLTASPNWRTVTEAWAAALPLATSGKSTIAQRKDADQKMTTAREAIAKLKQAGHLLDQEAELLSNELGYIRQDIYRNPPTDTRVLCYDMAFVPPAQRSFDRLARRLPLVERLVAGGKLHPAACTRIVAAIQADIAVLDARNLARLPEARRATARAAREQALAALRRLRQRLGPPRPMCYTAPPLPDPKRQSRRTLDERRHLVDLLESEGAIEPQVAAVLRQSIESHSRET